MGNDKGGNKQCGNEVVLPVARHSLSQSEATGAMKTYCPRSVLLFSHSGKRYLRSNVLPAQTDSLPVTHLANPLPVAILSNRLPGPLPGSLPGNPLPDSLPVARQPQSAGGGGAKLYPALPRTTKSSKSLYLWVNVYLFFQLCELIV